MKNIIEDIYQQSNVPLHEHDQVCVSQLWQAIKELKRMIEVLEREKADRQAVYK